MNFQPELAEKVMRGEKTVTRRLASDNPRSPWYWDGCSLQVGRDYAVCPGRGKRAIGRVRIIGVERVSLGYLSDLEARAEGFPDEAAFREAFSAINNGYYHDDDIWRVEFEVAETTKGES
jgi:hypothetical protein